MSIADEREVPGDDPGNDATPLPGQAREVVDVNTGSIARSGERACTPPTVAEFMQSLRDHVQPLLLDENSPNECLVLAKDWLRRRGGTTMVHAYKFKGDGIAPEWNLVLQQGEEPSKHDWNRALWHAGSAYTPLNPCLVPPESLKASKHHVIEVRCLGVDLDVAEPADDSADKWRHQLDGRAACARVIDEYVNRHGLPTECRDSGGGFQLVFNLAAPFALPPARLNAEGYMLREDGFTTRDPKQCALNPDRERTIAEVETRNRGLFERFRSIVADLGVAHLVKVDATQNIDRIFRVPHTPNRPCGKKRGRGRRPTMARLVFEDQSITYAIESFPTAADVAAGKKGKSRGVRVAVDVAPGPRRQVPLEELPAAVSTRCKKVIVHGKDDEQPLDGDDQSRSAWLFYAVGRLVRAGVDDEAIYSIITDRDYGISASVLDKGTDAQVHRYALKQIADARVKSAEVDAAPSPGNTDAVVLKAAHPKRVAELFRDLRYPHLLRTNGDYLDHAGSHYVEVEDDTVKRELWEFLDHAKVQKGNDEPKPFPLLRKNVGEVYEPFQLLVHEPRSSDAHHQRWLRGGAGLPPASEILALPNGLLHVPERRLLPHTADFFTRNLIDIPYDPQATMTRWPRFLEELWPGDEGKKERDLLQEIIGYLLIPDTSLQKLFFIKGPRRCGKGTILRVVADLVGKANVTGLSLNRVNQGTAPLEPLLGKLVWLVSDLRLENRAMAGAVERLLNITGEDVVTVERKYKPAWEGILPARVFMAANRVPRLSDPSGALAGRVVALEIEPSFFGKEDRGLQNKLRQELPGILNWALDGWTRLRTRGRFELPPKSQALVDAIYRTGSHVVAFLEECCEENPHGKVSKDALFAAYRRWCKANDIQHTLSKEELGSEVAAALHGIVRNGQRLSVQEGRDPAWGGIALKPEWVAGGAQATNDGPF